jgi:opacity protein-like surface antigen
MPRLAQVVARPALTLWLTAALIGSSASGARAQGFVSPLIGYDYGGDSGCRTFRGCEEKQLNIGIALGKYGGAVGFEQEFAYANHFFGEVEGQSSSVLTIMSNLLIAPKIGPTRPYGLIGMGFVKAHADLTPGSLLSFSNKGLGWDYGGGLAIFFGRHFGIRGDIRHFYAFEKILFLSVGETNLDFGRASAALVFAF